MIFEIDPRNQEEIEAIQVKMRIDEETCFTLTRILEELNNGLLRGKRLFKEHIAWEMETPTRKARVENLKQGILKKMNELARAGYNYRQIVSTIAKEFELTWDSADLRLRDARRELKEKHLQKRNKEMLKLKAQGIRTKDIAQKFNISVETAYNIISALKKPNTASCTPRHKKIKNRTMDHPFSTPYFVISQRNNSTLLPNL